MDEGKSYSKDDILNSLAQQPPFLFLDEAEIFDGNAKGSFNVDDAKVILEGHFKNNPILPGSVMLEALGQLAVLYLLKSPPEKVGGNIDPDMVFFSSGEGLRCSRICRPGDVLDMTIREIKISNNLGVFEGKITCKGEKTAYAERLTLAYGFKQ